MRKGFTLLELLVVVGVFAILAVVTTQIIAQSLRGTRKSEATIEVRENVDYMFAVMERALRSSQSLDCVSSTATRIEFLDETGNVSNFQCNGSSDGYLTHNGNNISGDKVHVNCSITPIFVCNQTDGTTPSSVEISIVSNEAQDAGIEGARVTSTTKIILRSF
ncbi:prepilin-type N-terminal cleavage/methylation domain-containing protein [Patescibacteria group bacterium]